MQNALFLLLQPVRHVHPIVHVKASCFVPLSRPSPFNMDGGESEDTSYPGQGTGGRMEGFRRSPQGFHLDGWGRCYRRIPKGKPSHADPVSFGGPRPDIYALRLAVLLRRRRMHPSIHALPRQPLLQRTWVRRPSTTNPPIATGAVEGGRPGPPPELGGVGASLLTLYVWLTLPQRPPGRRCRWR